MKAPAFFVARKGGRNMATENQGRYTTIRTTVWGRLTRMGLSRLARLILAELLHGDLRANVKSGILWPCGPAIVASIMNEPQNEVEAAMKELEEAGCLKMDMPLWIVWLRELWAHEWIANQNYAIAISREIQPMPPDSNIWPDVLGVFRALQDRLAEADDENLKKRATWYDPILSIVETKIGSKENIEATKEAYMYLIHVSDTCIGNMYRKHVSDTTNSLQPATNSLQPATNSLQPSIEKEKNIGLTLQARARATKTLKSFFSKYKTATGKEHPGISPSEKENILEGLDRIFASFEDVIDADPELSLQATIKQFFKDWKAGDLKAENPTIWLFLTPEVWRMRAFRAGVIDTEDVFDRADGSVLGEEGK